MEESAGMIFYFIAEIFGVGFADKVEDFIERLPRVVVIAVSILSILLFFLLAYLFSIWFGETF